MDWILYAIIAALLNTGAILIVKQLSIYSITGVVILFSSFLVASLILLPNLFFRGDCVFISTEPLLLIVAAGIVGALAYSLLYKYMHKAPNPAYPVSINDVNVVIVLIASVVLFSSDFSLIKFFGVLLCVIGVVFVGVGEKK